MTVGKLTPAVGQGAELKLGSGKCFVGLDGFGLRGVQGVPKLSQSDLLQSGFEVIYRGRTAHQFVVIATDPVAGGFELLSSAEPRC